MTSQMLKPRIAWLDAAKGIGILFVVLGHALGGLIDSNLGKDFEVGRLAFFAVYTFHMPLFLMLSGLLVAQRIATNPASFQRSLWTSIAWPYFLWSVIQFTIIYQLGTLVNQPVSNYWATIASLPWHTVSQFWFLYALFILHVLAMLALRAFKPATFLLMCFCLKPLAMIAPLPEVLHLAANQAPYYGIGVFLGQVGMTEVVVDRDRWIRYLFLPVVATITIALGLAAANSFEPGLMIQTAKAAGIANLAWHMQMLPAALTGAFAVVGLASLIGRGLEALLGYVGKRTMPIFVLHIMAIAGGRIVLTKFANIDNPWLVLIVTLVMGLAVPLMADVVFQRFKLSRALGLG
jgi:fucose 4-O-acetylase-like acetyltransferase